MLLPTLRLFVHIFNKNTNPELNWFVFVVFRRKIYKNERLEIKVTIVNISTLKSNIKENIRY